MNCVNRVFLCLAILVSLAGCDPAIFDPNVAKNNRRLNYILYHPELDPRVSNLIRDGKISIGMTREQVIASWGEPIDINRSVGQWGVHEQWVYGYDYKNRTYLYIEDGYLKSWNN